MIKKVAATAAKNNFGGLLDDVASLGRVEIVKHGRTVAIVLAPRELEALVAGAVAHEPEDSWRRKHAIPAELARRARIVHAPADFDDDSD
jgi:prevent-host-death family protein